ncbi:type VI secretion system Vgr family protein [Piscinibacterium candidicorallinum]|uniref:type VI secretion system Vgr family protein n=1 Tax=Piscinibacterium candidicorallinum TaxID=1793872 RepID=UPI003672A321
MAEDSAQGAVLASVSTPLGADKLLLRAAQISETLSQMPMMAVEMLSEDANIDYTKLLGKGLGIQLNLLGGGERHFHGLIIQMMQLGRRGRYLVYHAQVRPWLWLLSRTSDCKVFQNKTVKDIVSDVFADYPDAKFEWRLTGTYGRRVYTVQYRETDLNFVLRLLELEGIGWYFEHAQGKHTLVLTDSISKHKPFPDYEEIGYRNQNEVLRKERESVLAWKLMQQVQPGKVVLQDYDFTRSSVDLKQQRADPQKHAQAEGEIYDYPGLYVKEAEGSQYAQVRMEAFNARACQGEGASDARGLACGRTFKLKGVPRKAENTEYLVTSTRISIEQADYEATQSQEGSRYHCDFTVLDAAVAYRPERLTPKPFVQGPQTALVVGPGGEEIHTDTYGRVKVQFHWDRYGKKDDKSSCWVRVSQPWAGKNFGFQAIPRIGQEVIVDFLEGDPDQPIITGRVYNDLNMPPWELPGNKTQTGVLTRSSQDGVYDNANAIRFEDKKGAEQLWIHAEKNQDIEVENDETHWVGRDRKKTIDNDETSHIKHDRTETVDNNETITVHGARTETVDKDETITIHGQRTEVVDKDETISIHGQRTEAVDKNETITIGGARTESVAKDESITIGGGRTESVSKDESISIGGSRTESVAKDESITIGGARIENVSKDETISIGGGRTENVGKDESVTVGGGRTVSVGKADKLDVAKTLTINAGDAITIQTGSAKIEMKKDGTIKISGKDITIDGSGKINVKASSDVVIKGSKVLNN